MFVGVLGRERLDLIEDLPNWSCRSSFVT